MNSTDDAWRLSAADLHAAYTSGSLSPLDVTSAVLDRIASLNPRLNAFVLVDTDGARRAAEASAARYKAGKPLSPLDGVPVSIKDSLKVRGLPATWGSRLLEQNVPRKDEMPVARLRAAGAVILGKTNVPEFTVQGYTNNLLFGATGNPWNPDLTPGGSSGGAVSAVAAGLGPIAIGTDGGGSTRRPAGYTGLVGLKPSIGRVTRCDGFPEIYNDIEVIGLFGRSVEDVAATLCLVSTPDPRDRHSFAFYPRAVTMEETRQSADEPRILYLPRFGNHPVESGIVTAIDKVADQLGAAGFHVEEGAMPFDIDEATAALATMMPVGLAMIVDQLGGPEKISPALLQMYETGKSISGAAYLAALNHATKLRQQMAEFFFKDWDAILTPSAAAQPWAKDKVFPETINGEAAGPRAHAIYTGWVNLAGLPGLALPAAPDANGMPIGFQLVGSFGSDAMLLDLGRRYEAAHPEMMRWPPLAG